MKLLFFTDSMAPEVGGPAIEISRLTTNLIQDDNFNITVASSTPKSQTLPLDKRIIYFQFKKSLLPLYGWFNNIYRLKNLISENDVIFSTGIWGPIEGFALRLAWKRNKPVYIRVCGMLEPYILRKNKLKKTVGRFLYLNQNLKKAAGIIVNSQPEALNVLNLGVSKDKILIIPNGVQLSKSFQDKQDSKRSLGLDVNTKVLLYLGRIHPKKGLHFLLKAISSLSKDKRKFTLIIAGEFSDSTYESEIMNLVQTLSLEQMTRFSGIVHGEDKERHFNAADCFILPSQSEGLPNAVLEALAFGLPAIITNNCNIPEIAEYEAGLVIDLTITELAKSLEWFLSGTKTLQLASENALRLIEDKFSQEESINQYKQIIGLHAIFSH